jgi:TPP-dependent pyruvate/acetoin dehydrogenase alpha subunit
MTIQPGVGAAFENPLIPNARLRQIYLALLKARLLDSALPASRRSHTRGHEAALVSTSIDLLPGDLVSDTLTGSTISFLRGASLASAINPTSPPRKSSKKHATDAHCSAASALPNTPLITDRLWAALGAAAALKSQPPRTCPKADDPESAQPNSLGVVIFYALPGEVSPALWRNSLAFAAANELPIIFVILPTPRTQAFKTSPPKAARVSPIALRAAVPGIAVDADDPVAIYRVAQESIGRARAGGGPALIECIPFILEGVAPKRTTSIDAIAALEQYILHRHVVTQSWLDRESNTFALRLAALKRPS